MPKARAMARRLGQPVPVQRLAVRFRTRGQVPSEHVDLNRDVHGRRRKLELGQQRSNSLQMATNLLSSCCHPLCRGYVGLTPAGQFLPELSREVNWVTRACFPVISKGRQFQWLAQ